MRRRSLQTLAALVISGVWGASLGLAHLNGDIGLLGRFEAAISDLRMQARGVRAAPDLVTIVAIDDDTARQAGRYPLPRLTLAGIIEGIARLEPKVIAIDLLLVDQGPDDGDAALAQALGRRPTAIAAAAVFTQATQTVLADDGGVLSALPQAERFLLPLQRFADRAAVGIVNVTTDQTGTPRAVPMLFRTAKQIELSLPLRIAVLASAAEPAIGPNDVQIAGRRIGTDLDHVLPIGFYGPRGTIRTLSAAAASAGALPRDAIAGRIVVIGATVTGGGDFFPTPFDPVLPGVEVIATAVSHLMTGDGLLRDRAVRIADAIIAVVLPLILVGLLAWRRNAIGLILIAVVMLLWASLNFAAFSHGIWLSAALPLAAAVPPTMLFGTLQLWSQRQRAQHFATKSALFQQFQAPLVREWLSKDASFLLEPVQQNAAIVFIDLSGFTALSESLGADEVQKLLKEFHALVDREVTARGGVITSFMGDGAMILFGLPCPTAHDALNAAACCAGLCRQTKIWLESLPAATAAMIGFKIGAHSGEIVASRLGGGSHQHITATGDTVNVASRLMEVAARNGADLALSDQMLSEAGPDCVLFHTGQLNGPSETQIRGRSGALTVWLWRDAASPQS